jgi:hypothetical protein
MKRGRAGGLAAAVAYEFPVMVFIQNRMEKLGRKKMGEKKVAILPSFHADSAYPFHADSAYGDTSKMLDDT